MRQKIFLKIPKLIITGTVLLYILLAVLAPIAKHFGWSNIANPIYFVYSFLCHQKDTRSLHILGEKMAFCARDLGVFLPTAGIGILSLFPKIKLPNLNWKHYAALTTPLVVDGTVQLISEIMQKFGFRILIYESTNPLRLLTGIAFGMAIGLFIFSNLDKE